MRDVANPGQGQGQGQGQDQPDQAIPVFTILLLSLPRLFLVQLSISIVHFHCPFLVHTYCMDVCMQTNTHTYFTNFLLLCLVVNPWLVLKPGACFTKRSYIYELQYLINPFETMLANIQETLIHELICSIPARTVLVKQAHDYAAWARYPTAVSGVITTSPSL